MRATGEEVLGGTNLASGPQRFSLGSLLAARFSFLNALVPALILAYLAWIVGGHISLLGPAVTAMIAGTLIATFLPVPSIVRVNAGPLGGRLLRLSIILLGGSVDAGYVVRTAGNSLFVMLGTLAIGIFGIWQFGRLLGVDFRVRGLLTAGTSICGVSAIAAAAPAVGATAADVSYAVSVVVLFNVAAVVIFPIIGHIAGFSAHTFGIWAGTAVNDTSSVLAAGYAFGSGSATFAAVVKLARTVMILPVTAVMAILARRVGQANDKSTLGGESVLDVIKKALPWFIIGFVLLAVGRSLGLWPADVAHNVFGKLASYGVVLALATIGLSTDLHKLMGTARRGLLLGGFGWILLAVTSLLLQGVVAVIGG
jgi:uncharacterized integral membrane protein (TIGR00698 family)